MRASPKAENRDGEQFKVLLGANNAGTLAGMRLALDGEGFDVCGAATSVRDLIKAIGSCLPDVCLVAVEIEGGGLRAAAEISGWTNRIPLVLFAAEPTEAEFLDAMRAGAAGYVSQSIAPSRLPPLVRAVLRGEAAIPRSLARSLIDDYRQPLARRHLATPNGPGADLTIREWQVLECVRSGLSTREVAARLLISEVTVRRHISAVLKKLNVGSRDAALKLLESA